MSEETTTPMPASKALSWMPIFVDDLLSLSATLTPAQLGGLMRLRAYAWRQSPPATLPDSDARLATISGLGASWAEDGPAIRELLVPLGDTPEGKRLLDPWLDKVYVEQLNKYISAAMRGRKGGRPKAENKAELSAGIAKGKQPEKLSLNSALTELRSSLSSELTSSSIPQKSDETKAGEKLSFPVRREPEDPYRAADASVNSEAAVRDAAARALNEEYDAELGAEVERFQASNPAEYEDHRILAMKALGLFGRALTGDQQASIDAATSERIRKANGWPSRATYLANHGKRAPTLAQTRATVGA